MFGFLSSASGPKSYSLKQLYEAGAKLSQQESLNFKGRKVEELLHLPDVQKALKVHSIEKIALLNLEQRREDLTDDQIVRMTRWLTKLRANVVFIRNNYEGNIFTRFFRYLFKSSAQKSDEKIIHAIDAKIAQLGQLLPSASLKPLNFSVERFDYNNFKNWVCKRQSGSSPKKQLFEKTILEDAKKLDGQQLEIICFKASYPTQDLKKQQFGNEVGSFRCTSEYFDYSDQDHTYVDFANAHTFGGGWRGNGFVQEEIMFAQGLELALAAYLSDIQGSSLLPAHWTPTIIPEVVMRHKVPDAYYGNGKIPQNPEVEEFKNGKPVTIAAVAAKNWQSKDEKIRTQYKDSVLEKKYKREDIEHHLHAFYRVCMAEKERNPANPCVHTGAWGCGAFRNNVKVMVAIQLFAAKMAGGVALQFYGVDHHPDPAYNKNTISEISRIVADCRNEEEFLQKMVEFQRDPSWCPNNIRQ